MPVAASPDVCVVGGGASGLSAAVAARRLGLSTVLIEKYGFCGGATVAGLSGTICGLYSSGINPQPIVFGFASEFTRLMQQRSGICDAVPFGHTKLLPHDSFVWKEVADYLIGQTGIQVLYHSVFIKANCDESGSVADLLIYTPEGLCIVRPKVVVDASGDAAVVHSVGGDTTVGCRGVVQTPTMIFRMGGVDMDLFSQLAPEEICAAVREARKRGFDLPRDYVYLFPLPNDREVLCNMTRVTYADGSVPLGINTRDRTFAEMEGRRQARLYATFLRQCVAGFVNSHLVDTGAEVGIRQTRSIIGCERLTNADVSQGRKRKGAATFSAWPMESHGSGELRIQYLDDDTYDIPFEALIPQTAKNLLAAGRCFSAEHEALASARVTAQCFGMGYAAGAACGLVIREHIPAHQLSGPEVQHWMQANQLKIAAEA